MSYEIVPRSRWGATGGRGNDVRWRLPWAEGVKHTEAGPDRDPASFEDEAQAMRNIERFHVQVRGWNGVGYSFVIFPSGRIFEGRGWGRSGAHTETRNSTAAGICFAGHGDKSPATEAAIGAFHWLIRHGVDLGKLTGDLALTEHRDYSDKGKSCPGELIHRQEPVLNAWRTGSAPDPDPEELTMAQIRGIESRLDDLRAQLDDLRQQVQTKPVLVRDRTHKGIWILSDGFRVPFAPNVTDSAERLAVLELLVFLGSVAAPTGEGGRNLGDKIGWIDTADLDRIPVHPDFG